VVGTAADLVESCQDVDDLLYLKAKTDISRASFMEADDEEELVSPSTCENILDKLLVSAGVTESSVAAEGSECSSNVGLGEAQDWEESFNELFPDLI
jgi:hypothetical protein